MRTNIDIKIVLLLDMCCMSETKRSISLSKKKKHILPNKVYDCTIFYTGCYYVRKLKKKRRSSAKDLDEEKVEDVE